MAAATLHRLRGNKSHKLTQRTRCVLLEFGVCSTNGNAEVADRREAIISGI